MAAPVCNIQSGCNVSLFPSQSKATRERWLLQGIGVEEEEVRRKQLEQDEEQGKRLEDIMHRYADGHLGFLGSVWFSGSFCRSGPTDTSVSATAHLLLPSAKSSLFYIQHLAQMFFNILST